MKLHIAVVFFVAALIASLFGFGGIIGPLSDVAKGIYFVCLVVAVLFFCWSLRDAS